MKFHCYMLISLKVISVLQKKRKRGDKKGIHKKKKKGYDTAFSGLCIFAYQ